MISNSFKDRKLAHIFFREFSPYVAGLEQRKIAYKESEFFKFSKRLKNVWEDFVKDFSKEVVYARAKEYGLKKRELWKQFKKVFLTTLIQRFIINLDRAFAQAQQSIENNLNLDRTNPGFFGLRALYSLRKKKLAKPGPVEGISRLTSSGRIFHLKLVPYVKLLIITGQAEIIRRAEEIVSYNTIHDLVWIDQHPCWLGPKANEVCNRWRDRVVSLNGLTAKFPTMTQAKSEKPPLFHPNCTHNFHALTEREAQFATNRGIFFYSQLSKLLARG